VLVQPEMERGRSIRRAMPTRSSTSRTRLLRSLMAILRYVSGSSRFSNTVRSMGKQYKIYIPVVIIKRKLRVRIHQGECNRNRRDNLAKWASP
jgi:hypothetical protein